MHTTPCPPGGCWERLRRINAKILLLGEACEKLFAIEENCVIERDMIPEEWWK